MRRSITKRFEAAEGPGTWFYDVTYWREETDINGLIVELVDHVETLTMEGLLKQQEELAYALGNTGQLISECEDAPDASDQTPLP